MHLPSHNLANIYLLLSTRPAWLPGQRAELAEGDSSVSAHVRYTIGTVSDIDADIDNKILMRVGRKDGMPSMPHNMILTLFSVETDSLPNVGFFEPLATPRQSE